MRPLRLMVFLLLLAPARPMHAQARVATPREVFDMFLRLSSLLGKPAREAQGVWPLSARPSGAAVLQPTGAHQLRMTFSALLSETSRDTTVRAATVSLRDLSPDTTALRDRMNHMTSVLQQRLGVPDLCGGPLGSPSYLYARQEVIRFWRKGLNGFPTQLRMVVSAEEGLQVDVRAGYLTPEPADAIACDVRMP